MKGITTKILNTPIAKDDVYGSIRFPVYDTAAYEFDTSADIAEAFQGKVKAHQYTRGSNPTVEHYENIVKEITGAHAVVATASGMAAISNTLLAISKAGDNIVASSYLFGNTFSLLESTLKEFGIECRFVSMLDLADVEANIDGNTRGLLLEAITNPQLEVADLSAVSAIAKRKNVPVLVDSTLTPPAMFCAKAVGVDVEIMSATKYFSGGGTSIGGVIVDYATFDWSKNPKVKAMAEKFGANALFAKLKKEIFRNMGACLSPHNAYLQSLGLETLDLRVKRTCENAMAVAKWLSEQEKVKDVNYPGLPDNKFHNIAKAQFGTSFGGILTFDLDSEQACFDAMDKLNIIRRATNLNDNRTLAIHPWSTIYAEFDDEKKKSQGLRDTSIRLSCGIEESVDLIEDLNQAIG